MFIKNEEIRLGGQDFKFLSIAQNNDFHRSLLALCTIILRNISCFSMKTSEIRKNYNITMFDLSKLICAIEQIQSPISKFDTIKKVQNIPRSVIKKFT